MERIVGCCGLVCTDCAAYLATQSGDRAAQEQVVELWRKEHNAQGITVESTLCDGCPPQGERHAAYCGQCPSRTCGLAHDVRNCAYCDEYACEKLAGFHERVPAAHTVLEEIRAASA